jgi:hypothetical protein
MEQSLVFGNALLGEALVCRLWGIFFAPLEEPPECRPRGIFCASLSEAPAAFKAHTPGHGTCHARHLAPCWSWMGCSLTHVTERKDVQGDERAVLDLEGRVVPNLLGIFTYT